MASHIFVTAKYLDRCVETGLFGVTVEQVNYLAAVSPGDTAFLLETGTGRLAGPFSVRSPLFFSQTPVWNEDATVRRSKRGEWKRILFADEEEPSRAAPDRFTYRLRLGGTDAWEGDVTALWQILHRRHVSEFFSFTTFQRSSIGLIESEGEAIAEVLKRTAARALNPGALSIEERPIDLLRNDVSTFASEARLEASLLLAKAELLLLLEEEGHLPQSTSPRALLNQVTLPGLNYNVDILLLCENSAVVVELKKDRVDERARLQLRRYGRYWEACGLGVRLVAIGRTVDQIDPCIAAYSYSIDRAGKTLRLERGGKRWDLPARTGG